jgi:hypothetical protein
MAALGLADPYGVSDRRSTHDIDDEGIREKLTKRVGRPVNAVALVRPMSNSAARWGRFVASLAPGPADGLSSAVLAVALTGALERRSARAAGLPRQLALAVTEHDAHLFRTRMFDHVIRDHVATVPYGMVSAVRVSKRAGLAKLTIELVDGAEIRLEGHQGQGRSIRKVFDLLRHCAAAVPVGTVPPPAARPEANVAGVPDRVAGLVAKGAGAVAEQVKAHCSGSRRSAP